MAEAVQAQVLSEGTAHGEVLRLQAPISFWGGVDDTGTIVDVHHPNCGASVTGKVLVMFSGRGSSSSSSCLAELIRLDAGPLGIVMGRRDAIVALGAIVARELYEKPVPVVVAPWDDLDSLTDGKSADVSASAASGGAISWDADAAAPTPMVD